MDGKHSTEPLVRVKSVEEAELIVADMERVIGELKATINLIKQMSPGAAYAVAAGEEYQRTGPAGRSHCREV